MRRILQFITEYRRSVTLVVTLFLSVSLMLMGEGAKTHFARAVTVAIFNTGKFTLSWGISMLDLWKENRELRLQNLELTWKVSQNTLAVRENERLRRMLDLKQKNSFTLVAANVLGRDTDRVVNALVIDIGSREGIRKNMVCVTADGLVGRVYEVYRGSSSVQLIADTNSRVSGMVVARNTYGVVSWDGGRYLRMYGLPLINDVQAGDMVYTTGLGGVYPAGIPIGTVAHLPRKEVEIYASIDLKPAVDFSRVHELFVLKGSERSDIWNDGKGSLGYFQRSTIQ